MAFVRIAKVSDLRPGSIQEFQVEDTAVALANVAGKIYAINNTCLHQGGPLGEGDLEGAIVTCPWHGWQFNVTDGKDVQNPTVGVVCYPLELRDDEIFIDISPQSERPPLDV
jgi:nitrite reductase (NADH) small subunit